MWDLKTDHNEQLVSELNASGQNLGNSNGYYFLPISLNNK